MLYQLSYARVFARSLASGYPPSYTSMNRR